MKKIKLDYRELLNAISEDFNDCGAYKWLEKAIALRLGAAGVDLDKIDLSNIIDLLVVQMEEDLLDDFLEEFNSNYFNKDDDGNEIYQLEYIND